MQLESYLNINLHMYMKLFWLFNQSHHFMIKFSIFRKAYLPFSSNNPLNDNSVNKDWPQNIFQTSTLECSFYSIYNGKKRLFSRWIQLLKFHERPAVCQEYNLLPLFAVSSQFDTSPMNILFQRFSMWRRQNEPRDWNDKQPPWIQGRAQNKIQRNDYRSQWPKMTAGECMTNAVMCCLMT